jgi:DNA-binding response OmpR family regulator
MKQKILYIEDEPFLGKIVKETLEHRGFEVLLVNDGAKVLQSFKSFTPDVCVLDVMLPNIDGFTLGRNIRNIYPRLPVIFLTAKSQTEDLIKGFEHGGTDYIKKPFSMEELIVRINNQFQLLNQKNNSAHAQQEKIQLGKFCFYPGKYELHFPGNVIKLSNRESQVLNMLASHRNQTIERKNLLLAVWGDDSFFNSRTLDVYIRKLRDYFSAEKGIEIVTLKGKGYHFVVP